MDTWTAELSWRLAQHVTTEGHVRSGRAQATSSQSVAHVDTSTAIAVTQACGSTGKR